MIDKDRSEFRSQSIEIGPRTIDYWQGRSSWWCFAPANHIIHDDVDDDDDDDEDDDDDDVIHLPGT